MIAIARHPCIEVAHTLVSQSGTHGCRWQQYHAGVQHYRCRTCFRGRHLSRRHRIGTQRTNLHIQRIGLDSVNHRTVVLNCPYSQDGTVTAIKAGHLIITVEPLRHIYKACLSLRITAYNLELIDDRVYRRLFQRFANGIVLFGKNRLHIFFQEERLRTILLKIDGRTVHLLTTHLLKTLWHALEARHSQNHTVQQRVVNLQIPIVLNVAHGEEALLHGASLLHHLVVRVFMVCHCRVFATLYLFLVYFN